MTLNRRYTEALERQAKASKRIADVGEKLSAQFIQMMKRGEPAAARPMKNVTPPKPPKKKA